MGKYYVQNGDTKLVIQVDTVKEATFCIIKAILENEKDNVSLITSVSQSGFIEDLLAENMIDRLDEGFYFLTSKLFLDYAEYWNNLDAMNEDVTVEDILSNKVTDLCFKYHDGLVDVELKIIGGDSKEADLLVELAGVEFDMWVDFIFLAKDTWHIKDTVI